MESVQVRLYLLLWLKRKQYKKRCYWYWVHPISKQSREERETTEKERGIEIKTERGEREKGGGEKENEKKREQGDRDGAQETTTFRKYLFHIFNEGFLIVL